MINQKIKKQDISVIIPMLNAEKTLYYTLKSLQKQNFPIKEIIIIDNHSSDSSVDIAKLFKNKNKKIPIKIIEREKTYNVGSSYNLGIKLAKTPLVIVMHSDSILPSNKEIRILVEPFFHDDAVVSTYSIMEHPKEVWLSYNFWQKCQFINALEKPSAGMFGKFDCYKKTSFLQIGGSDVKNFIPGIGSEDANLHFRFEKIGKVVSSKAHVIHLHYISGEYTLRDWISRCKLMARSNGRLVRINWKDLKVNSIIFFIKPLLASSILFSVFNPIFLSIPVLFSFTYMKRMYFEKSTREDLKILLLPFVSIFLLYYETFWILEAFLLVKKTS